MWIKISQLKSGVRGPHEMEARAEGYRPLLCKNEWPIVAALDKRIIYYYYRTVGCVLFTQNKGLFCVLSFIDKLDVW